MDGHLPDLPVIPGIFQHLRGACPKMQAEFFRRIFLKKVPGISGISGMFGIQSDTIMHVFFFDSQLVFGDRLKKHWNLTLVRLPIRLPLRLPSKTHTHM